MNRLVGILTTIILVVLAVLPFAAAAEAEGKLASGDYEYLITPGGGSATITKYTGSAAELNIPAELDGLPVTAIGELAFSGNGSLMRVTIPDSVVSIGKSAFSNCQALERVSIGAGVLNIPSNPFFGCGALKEIEVSPGNPAFRSVDQVLFNSIEGRLVAYPAGLMNLNYIIPEGTKIIGRWAFMSYSPIMSITIPEGVETIEQDAFTYMMGLKSVVIPDSVKSIGRGAFALCLSLERVELGSGVVDIGGNPFLWCSALSEIVVSPGNPVLSVRDGALIYEPEMKLLTCLSSVGEKYEVPEGVLLIGESAFSNMVKLIEVVLPEGLTGIGDSAFSNCSNLARLTVPDSVTSIGEGAFEGCDALAPR